MINLNKLRLSAITLLNKPFSGNIYHPRAMLKLAVIAAAVCTVVVMTYRPGGEVAMKARNEARTAARREGLCKRERERGEMWMCACVDA